MSCPTVLVEGEPLPSALENFIKAFFGEVTKTTDSAGNFVWTLPCNLDAGIDGFPRVEGEGLACYFARILGQQIQGLQGKDAFGITTAAFVQPAVGDTVTVAMNTVDSYAAGQYVWLPASGFYTITVVDTVQVKLTLQNSYGTPHNLSPGASVLSGQKVLPSGVPEAAGPQGIQGPEGAVGPAGPTGAAGAPAYSQTTAAFTQPAVGGSVLVYVASVAPYSVGEKVWGTLGGFYNITAIDPNALTLTLTNLFDTTYNAAPSTLIPASTKLLPSGPQGVQGPEGSGPVRAWQFDTAGTFTWQCPTGVTSLRVRLYGGGGGGGGGASTAHGGAGGYGGGGGEYADGTFPVSAGVAYTIVVGAAGGGGTGGDSTANGAAGSASSFSNSTTTFLSAAGGSGGGNPISGAGGTGGTGGLGVATNRFPGFDGALTIGGHAASMGIGGLADSAGHAPGGGGGAGSGAGTGAGLPGQSGAVGRVVLEVVS